MEIELQRADTASASSSHQGSEQLLVPRSKDPTIGSSPGKTLLQGRRILRTPLAVIVALAAIVFVIQFGNSLSDVPATRLLEDIICRAYYGEDSSPSRALMDEAACQGEEVQGELNVVSMGLTVSGFIPGILVALLFGSLSDAWGRKPVFWLCIFGIVASNLWFVLVCLDWTGGSIRLVWTSSIPLLMGGGSSVAEAMVFAIISDLSTELNRATHFQIVISAVLLAETLAPIAANALMGQSIWIPLILSPCIAAFGALFMFFIPETLHLRAQEQRHVGLLPSMTSLSGGRKVAFYGRIVMLGRSLCTTLKLLGRRPAILLVPAAVLTIPLATISISLALRYVAVRFQWPLGQAGILLGLRTGMSIIVLLVLLPLLAYGLRRRSTRARDLLMAQVSAAFVVAGMAVFGAAPAMSGAAVGLAIFTLGSGVPSLTRAVLSSLVDGGRVGQLFAVLAMLETAGYLACALGLGALFQAGLDLGIGGNGAEGVTALLGLPFFCAALVALLTGVALWCVRLPRAEADIAGC